MGTDNIALKQIVTHIKPVDKEWIEKAKQRTSQLVMPARALGRLHHISEKICAIRQTLTPSINRKAFLVMAGDHGVVEEGVSAYPQEVTGEMIKTFLNGGAGINILAHQVNADVFVVDMGIITDLDPVALKGKGRLFIHKVAKGTANLSRRPAMTREEAEKSMLTGFQLASDLFKKGIDMLGTGDMGIGNTTPSAAIGTVLTKTPLNEMVGRGTGIDNQGLLRKQKAIQRGIELNRPDMKDGLDVLAKLGGFEIGGIAGCILAGAYHERPVVIDGFISTAGALVAHSLCPAVVDYLFAGHCSEESGHRSMLKHLDLEPVLDLGMRLGEGSGGALAMGIIDGAIKIFTDMLTFDQAGVSNKS
ncbi:MAG: nicotinate-nucleotide--dimethylbenzimidazole phosphoribosyltransferase [Deltaproteobacteria bacterium]|nr:nicotinate-nucleotide--dimethylbenzimidazole phosphoribosyltransferase [Deltaproteobacteria bacterium]